MSSEAPIVPARVRWKPDQHDPIGTTRSAAQRRYRLCRGACGASLARRTHNGGGIATLSRGRTRCPRCHASRCTNRCRRRAVALVPRRAGPVAALGLEHGQALFTLEPSANSHVEVDPILDVLSFGYALEKQARTHTRGIDACEPRPLILGGAERLKSPHVSNPAGGGGTTYPSTAHQKRARRSGSAQSKVTWNCLTDGMDRDPSNGGWSPRPGFASAPSSSAHALLSF